MHVDDVVADFDEGVGVGLQVPVPGGVIVDTIGRGEHQIPFAVGEVHHDVGSRLPAACTHGVQDDQRRPLERAADTAMVGAELRYAALVEITTVAHLILLTSTDASYPVTQSSDPPQDRSIHSFDPL